MESLENWGIYKAIYETEVEYVHERKSLENIKIPTELKNSNGVEKSDCECVRNRV